MKKISIFRCLLLAAVALAPVSVMAQVTIGSTATAQNFSVLELMSNQTLGFRLPQMTVAQRNALQASFGTLATTEAMGLQIFNIDTRCVETWNGGNWISTCGSTVAPPSVDPIICNESLGPVSIPVFMAYNLGADPTLDTPKKQMNYLANTGTASTPTNNGRVYGGRYQWGRANLPYAISTDGNYTLYTATNSISLQSLIPASYSGSGQIIGQDNNHVYVNPQILSTYDWRTGESSPVQQDNLWDSNGGTQDGSLTPLKSVNDPCPSGWRVPTQEDWERLGNYDCDPTVAGGAVSIASGVSETDNGFVWARVACSSGTCSVKTSNWAAGDNSGYAVYRASDWNSGSWDNTGNLLDASAPSPFLFLPAAGYRYRNSGTVSNVGTSGYYWSSTVNGVNARYLYLYSSIVNPASLNSRSYGLSVRCVAE